MTITTLMAEATATVRRPFLQRISHRFTGRPASSSITLPIIAEVLVELTDYGIAPMVRIVILAGRPAILLVNDSPLAAGPRAKVLKVVRACIREKGAQGRFFPVLWADPEEEGRKDAAAESAKALEERDAARFHIGGIDLSRGPDFIAYGDGRTFTGEEVEAGRLFSPPGAAATIMMRGVHGAFLADAAASAATSASNAATARTLVASLEAGLERAEERRILINMAQHHEAEAERFSGMHAATGVAKRRADYAMRRRSHEENAAALRRAAARIVPPDRVEPAPHQEA